MNVSSLDKFFGNTLHIFLVPIYIIFPFLVLLYLRYQKDEKDGFTMEEQEIIGWAVSCSLINVLWLYGMAFLISGFVS